MVTVEVQVPFEAPVVFRNSRAWAPSGEASSIFNEPTAKFPSWWSVFSVSVSVDTELGTPDTVTIEG